MCALPVEARKHERHFSAEVFADGLNPVARLHSLKDVLNEMGGGPAIGVFVYESAEAIASVDRTPGISAKTRHLRAESEPRACGGAWRH